MSSRVIIRAAVFVFTSFLSLPGLRAQNVCEFGNGRLDPSQPSAQTRAEIIKEFSAKEAVFKAARETYGYVTDVTVQTLNRDTVSGEYRLTSEMALDSFGKRNERMTFAPESSLRGMSVSEDDLLDIRTRLPFAFTPDVLPQFSITYTGRQHVDQIDTYVFKVSPKESKNSAKLFDGRIWVDDQDLAIVKTCGKPRRGDNETAKRGPSELVPVFVTYREQIDGQYWFTTYAHADEYLMFPKYSVHIRETIKYSDFRPLNKSAVEPSR